MLKFPEKFLWGAGTSAYQVEGDSHNDWTEWELKTAKTRAQNAEENPPYGGWSDYILNPPAGGPNPLQEENYISGKACDHYNRFGEDFDIAKSLGHNAHKFSIEWSRIEPAEGKFDEQEIEHYRQIVLALREREIEPFVTLWHWTLPPWLRDKGGVLAKNFPEYFARYTEKVVDALNDNVKFWITINEPGVYSKISYLEGRWPPQKKNLFLFLKVSRRLVRAHRLAYLVIKKIQPNSLVGIAHNMSFFEVESGNVFNRLLKKVGEWRKNFAFLNAISDYQDFIGFNYYSHYRINWQFLKIKTEKNSDLGWSLYPPGIYMMLCALKKYGKPIYITENGLADARDRYRPWFITETLKNVHRAIEAGVDVRGYMHWSLLDNFEWSDGFWPRFGLVEIDYRTLERKIRPSAYKYAEIINRNGIE